jgi:hypothetical protein
LKKLDVILLSLFFSFVLLAPSRVVVASPMKSLATGHIAQRKGIYEVLATYSQAQIDQMLVGTKNTDDLRKLIKCESHNTNIARIDSNGLMSWGLLQFNGTATWSEFSKLANVTGTPMMPKKAIQVADFMINAGQIKRWTCARILNL